MRRMQIVSMAFGVAFLLSACSGGKAQDERSAAQNGDTATQKTESMAATPKGTVKDILTVALDAEPARLDPHTQNLPQAYNIQQMILEPLIKKGADGGYEPCLAESWELTDDTTVVFHLRDNVYFHNGEKLTADDVLYTLNRAKTGSATKTQLSDIDESQTRALDELTVEMKLHQPSSAALNYLSTARGQILNKKAMEELGEDAHGRAPVGTGPYTFVEWAAGDHVSVIRNENYWGKQPVVQGVTY